MFEFSQRACGDGEMAFLDTEYHNAVVRYKMTREIGTKTSKISDPKKIQANKRKGKMWKKWNDEVLFCFLTTGLW
jgi:hypothetical protein